MTDEQAFHSDALYRARWQSLLSVDDMVEGVVAQVETMGEIHKTYFIFSAFQLWLLLGDTQVTFLCCCHAVQLATMATGSVSTGCPKESGTLMTTTCESRL